MELILNENILSTSNKYERSKQILEFCQRVNPQFYTNKKLEDLVKELSNIEILTQCIPDEVMEQMCKLAVMKYNREQDGSLVFNLSYILEQRNVAEFMVRNQVKEFDEFYANIDDVLEELKKD